MDITFSRGAQDRIPAKGEVYEHFKGNIYYVIGHAHDTETGKILVLYKHLDQKNNHQAYIWARPLDIWSEAVFSGQSAVPRFRRREDLETVWTNKE